MAKRLRLRSSRATTGKLSEKTKAEQHLGWELAAAWPAKLWIPQLLFAREHNREWRLDFALPEIKLGLEVDGGIWQKGGGYHSHPTGIIANMEKKNAAALLGWRVLCFTPEQVMAGVAFAFARSITEKELFRCATPGLVHTDAALLALGRVSQSGRRKRAAWESAARSHLSCSVPP